MEIVGDLAKLNRKLGGMKAAGSKTSSNLAFDELSARETVRREAQRSIPSIDLSPLRYYDEEITRQTLEPIYNAETASSLKALDVHFLRLNDDALTAVSKLRLLRLDASRNNLRTLSALSNMGTLQSLNVTWNPLTDEAFKVIGRLQELRKLNISNTPVKDDDLRKWSGFKQLTSLSMTDTNVSLAALREFKKRLGHHCEFNAGLVPDISVKLDKYYTEYEKKEYGATERGLQKELDRWLQQSPPDNQTIAAAYRLLGRCFEAEGLSKDADDAYKNSIALYFKQDVERMNLTDRNNAFCDYIRRLSARGEWQQVLDLRVKIEKLYEAQQTKLPSISDYWDQTRCSNFIGMAEAYLHLKKPSQAGEAYLKAAELSQTADVPDYDNAIVCLMTAGDCLQFDSNAIGRRQCYEKAEKLLPKIGAGANNYSKYRKRISSVIAR